MPTNPVVTLVDSTGAYLKTSSNADGTANLVSGNPGAMTFLTYFSAAQSPANSGTSFSTVAVEALAVDVTLTSFTGGTSPSITFFVERLGADNVWYRIWTSAALTSAGATSVQIGPFPSGTGIYTAVLTGTARFGWSTAGSPTAVTFSASVIGR